MGVRAWGEGPNFRTFGRQVEGKKRQLTICNTSSLAVLRSEIMPRSE